jgi:hypothetical protein
MAKKDFQKGMEAGAKPFEDKFKQQANAINRVSDKLEKGIEKVSGVVHEVVDELTSIEKKRLYDLNTQFDIKNLEDHEKELLLAGLFTLAGETANENQQAYVRSVKKYLDIKNPQTDIDLSGIENLTDLNAQKAIFNAFAEFLFLSQNDDSFLDEKENLFDLFSVKRKDRDAIINSIHSIYNAVGAQGLCEHYGFVADDGKGVLQIETAEPMELTKLTLKEALTISIGEERKFEKQDIKIAADIEVEGSLIFDHCVITYNGDDIEGRINIGARSAAKGSVTFTNCTIIGKNNKEPESCNPLISGGNSDSKIIIEKTLFKDCRNFMNVSDFPVNIENCIFRFTKLQQCISVLECDEDATMTNCLVENFDPKGYSEDESNYDVMFRIGNVKSCTFKNIKQCFKTSHNYKSVSLSITSCHFDNCSKIISDIYRDLEIKESLFEHCSDIIMGTAHESYIKIKNCKFIYCKNSVFNWREVDCTPFEITKCEFINYRAEDSNFADMAPKGGAVRNFSKCLFDGIYIGSEQTLIGLSIYNNKSDGVSFEKCTFRHCLTKDGGELMKTTKKIYGAFGKVSTIDVIYIDDCTGLDEINGKGENGSIPEDQIVRQGEDDEPYGIKESELTNIGVPEAVK